MRARLDIGRDREAGAQPRPQERVLMPDIVDPQPTFEPAQTSGRVGGKQTSGDAVPGSVVVTSGPTTQSLPWRL
jgi:hypothetical protein